MNNINEYNITTNFNNLGHLVVVANIDDKHGRFALSNYHWTVRQCRMIIFSTSSLLVCPDKSDVKKIHIIFNKIGNDLLTSLFMEFSLCPDGSIRGVTSDIYQLCFQYTMAAKIAPVWNTVGYNNFINNRDFLTTPGPQDGIQITTRMFNNNNTLKLQLQPVKINMIKSKQTYLKGETVKVLPSLNKCIIEEHYNSFPVSAKFKCYEDLCRYWENIHGYRLPEVEDPCYYSVQFWRGDPLLCPAICLTSDEPIITLVPKVDEQTILTKFIHCLQSKMPSFLGNPLLIEPNHIDNTLGNINSNTLPETQAVSLCTPTQDSTQKHLS